MYLLCQWRLFVCARDYVFILRHVLLLRRGVVGEGLGLREAFGPAKNPSVPTISPAQGKLSVTIHFFVDDVVVFIVTVP